MRSFRNAGAAVAIVVLMLAGCGGDDDGATPDGTGDPVSTAVTSTGTAETGTPTSAAPAEEGCTADRKGGEISMGLLTPTAGLDPIVSQGTGTAGGHELGALYDTLVRWDPDTASWQPHVAESFEPNDDFTEWTVRLRPDVFFGSGNPLTADAVKASIERFRTPEATSARRGQVARIESITVVDPLTVRLTLFETWGSFPLVLADLPGMIVDPEVAAALGTQGLARNPAGAGVGPYEVERYAPGEELVLRARDDYWGGPVCVETLRFVTVTGAQATYEAFTQGELQVALVTNSTVIAAANEDDVDGYSDIVNVGSEFLLNNGRNGADVPTADVRVRQAVVAAIDPAVIEERVFDGTGLPTSAIIHERSGLYQGLSGPAHDPTRAEQLVQEVKQETGWDGSIRLLCSQSPESSETTVATKAMLDSVGFDVRIDLVPPIDHQRQVIVDGNYDIACWGTQSDEPSISWGLNNFHSKAGNNFTGHNSPAMDAGLDQLRAAGTLAEQRAALATMQEAWNENPPAAVTRAVEWRIIREASVHGLRFNSAAVVMFDQAYLES